MRHGAALACALAALGRADRGDAADLVVTRTSVVVGDGINGLNPRALPGALVDHRIVVANPVANALASVGAVTVVEMLPVSVKLRVADLAAAGGGPVEFVDGGLLGIGLLASGLSFAFVSLASAGDGVDFSADGKTWGYVPVADAGGFDARVRAIRIRLSGSQAAGGGFRLRFRVAIR